MFNVYLRLSLMSSSEVDVEIEVEPGTSGEVMYGRAAGSSSSEGGGGAKWESYTEDDSDDVSVVQQCANLDLALSYPILFYLILSLSP